MKQKSKAKKGTKTKQKQKQKQQQNVNQTVNIYTKPSKRTKGKSRGNPSQPIQQPPPPPPPPQSARPQQVLYDPAMNPRPQMGQGNRIPIQYIYGNQGQAINPNLQPQRPAPVGVVNPPVRGAPVEAVGEAPVREAPVQANVEVRPALGANIAVQLAEAARNRVEARNDELVRGNERILNDAFNNQEQAQAKERANAQQLQAQAEHHQLQLEAEQHKVLEAQEDAQEYGDTINHLDATLSDQIATSGEEISGLQADVDFITGDRHALQQENLGLADRLAQNDGAYKTERDDARQEATQANDRYGMMENDLDGRIARDKERYGGVGGRPNSPIGVGEIQVKADEDPLDKSEREKKDLADKFAGAAVGKLRAEKDLALRNEEAEIKRDLAEQSKNYPIKEASSNIKNLVGFGRDARQVFGDAPGSRRLYELRTAQFAVMKKMGKSSSMKAPLWWEDLDPEDIAKYVPGGKLKQTQQAKGYAKAGGGVGDYF